MKSLLLIGALLGFGIGLAFSLAQESPWPASLWHACLTAYLTSLMLRWWGRAWRANLATALRAAQSSPNSAGASELPRGGKV
jgi:hypothetical protein